MLSGHSLTMLNVTFHMWTSVDYAEHYIQYAGHQLMYSEHFVLHAGHPLTYTECYIMYA